MSTAPPLHVIDEADPQMSLCLLAHLADLGEPVWMLGTPKLRRAAASVGLGFEACFTTPAGRSDWWIPGVRHAVHHLEPARPVHVWSLRLAQTIRQLGWGGPLVVHQLAPQPSPDWERLRELLPQCDTCIVLYDPHAKQAALDLGWPREHIGLGHLDSYRFQARSGLSRAAARQCWDLGDDRIPVVALLSDPPTAADATSATMAINLIAESSQRELRLLVHPEQAGRPRAQCILDDLGVGDRLIQDAAIATPWEILSGVDAVLLGGDTAMLSCGYAIGRNLPVVSPNSPTLLAPLHGYDSAVIAPTSQPKKLADRLQHGALGLPSPRWAIPSTSAG